MAVIGFGTIIAYIESQARELVGAGNLLYMHITTSNSLLDKVLN